jgi:hypothetical protein|tara:strand:+ start:125 stop:355 length:231 start_codon:yes stop_codon:yes gene_type:complete
MSYELIPPNDPRYFTETCPKPYDRHSYRVVFSNGQSEWYPHWDVAQARWFQTPNQFLSHIEVVDPKKKKEKSGGFA